MNENIDSILLSMKKLLGIASENTDFDADVIIHINSTFSILTQLGVGPPDGFYIEGDVEEWGDYLNDLTILNDVKTYMYLKVKTIFDPSASSVIAKAHEQTIKELEWRLNISAETP